MVLVLVNGVGVGVGHWCWCWSLVLVLVIGVGHWCWSLSPSSSLQPASNHSKVSFSSAKSQSPSPSILSGFEVIDSVTCTEESDSDESIVSHISFQSEALWTEVLGRHRIHRQRAPHQNPPRPLHRKSNQSGSHGDQQRISVIIGRGPSASIQAISDSKGNKQCTGLFVSRLKPCTSAAQLAVYVHREAGITVRPEKMPAKSASYSSFFIRCSTHLQRKLMDTNHWPKGTVVKPFYDR